MDSYLPRFLRRYPTATIHYRWPQRRRATRAVSSSRDPDPAPDQPRLHWPTPLHDALAGYDHLAAAQQPRDVYVYGSYLGAGLAASLALTESHRDEPVAVRGLVALNGVYNWTTFLPDHPVNALRSRASEDLGLDVTALEGAGAGARDLERMKRLMPVLFRGPSDLFDPFASPLLLFHTPGMLVPPGFADRWKPRGGSSGGGDDVPYVYSDPEDPPPPSLFPDLDTDQEEDNSTDFDASEPPPPLRRGYLAFPPRTSDLRIPETLLLHSSPPPLPQFPGSAVGPRKPAASWKKLKNAENSFSSQAVGLAGLMRRSLERFELRDRMRWDDELADLKGEARRRVGTEDVGPVKVDNLGTGVEETVGQWLEDRLG